MEAVTAIQRHHMTSEGWCATARAAEAATTITAGTVVDSRVR
jgi:hypothetical protein